MILIEKSQQKFLEALLEGNRLQCSFIVNELVDNNISIKDIYEDIIKTSLYEVGELWETNKISVATEHLASAISEAILNEHYLSIASKSKINKTVLLSCVENEYHQIGIKMINDVFEMNGWNTYFLGSNTPTIELISFAKTIPLNLIAISLSIYFNLPELEKTIKIFRKEFPKTPILVGGQAFRNGGLNVLSKYKNVTYQPDLKSAELFINSLNNYG